jgi:hypothetical protein
MKQVLSSFEKEDRKRERSSVVCKSAEKAIACYRTLHRERRGKDGQFSWDNFFKKTEEAPSKPAEEPSALTYTETPMYVAKSSENSLTNVYESMILIKYKFYCKITKM